MARWIYGKHAVLERLNLPDPGLSSVVAAKGQKPQAIDEIIQAAARANIRVEWRDRGWLDERAGSKRHQGIVASAEQFRYAELSDILEGAPANALLLVLDGVEDPGNLGALIRSAECAGACGVVIPTDRAVQVTAVAEKASAGAAGRIPIANVTNMSRALEDAKKSGFWTYGLAAGSGECLYDVDFSGKVCLVLGGEGDGIRPLVSRNCDKLIGIPLLGKVGSLNVSVAAGIALFEVVRQRTDAKES